MSVLTGGNIEGGCGEVCDSIWAGCKGVSVAAAVSGGT